MDIEAIKCEMKGKTVYWWCGNCENRNVSGKDLTVSSRDLALNRWTIFRCCTKCGVTNKIIFNY